MTPTPSSSKPVQARKPRAQQQQQQQTEKRKVKILMLHGYTQNGPQFRSKTRALEKLLAKSLSPHNLAPVLTYPTGPMRLRASDVPGYQPPTAGNRNGGGDERAHEQEGGGGRGDEEEELEAYAWWRVQAGSYLGFDRGISTVADAIASAGGDVDGVIGFSQGGAMAAMVAAVLEGRRPVPSSSSSSSSPSPSAHDPAIKTRTPTTATTNDEDAHLRALGDANNNAPLKFAVVYSGFWKNPPGLEWLMQPKKLDTPTLHVLGSLDSVVPEKASMDLVDRCVDPVVVTHPGGHHVPVAREWVAPLAGFVKAAMDRPKAKDGDGRNGVGGRAGRDHDDSDDDDGFGAFDGKAERAAL